MIEDPNISASNADLIAQALAHPPLDMPSMTAVTATAVLSARLHEPEDTIYGNFARVIDRADRLVLGVGGGPAEPAFAYTVGNVVKDLPELLIIGLGMTDAQAILNYASDTMIKDGALKAGSTFDLGGKFPLKVIRASAEAKADCTCQVTNFFEIEDYEVLQLLVPDTEGRYPGEPGCADPYGRVKVYAEN